MANDDLSRTYTWYVTSESNGGNGNVGLQAPLGKRARIATDAADVAVTLDGNRAVIYLTPEALDSLASSLAYWQSWRREMEAQRAERPASAPAAARLYNALDDNLIDSGGVDEFNVINNCFDALLDETKRRREREAALLNLSRVALDNHQRREAALLAVVRAVDHYGSPCSCPDTEAPHWHEADCPVAQARAALADADAGKE